MERLGDSLSRELGRFGATGAMPAITAAWPVAVGAEVARNAWPARVARDGVLHVHTSSSAWAFELTQLAAVVLGQLGEALGDDAPAGLRFAPGPLPEPVHVPEEQPARTVHEPSAEVAREADRLAAGIADEELRTHVARAAALSLEHARSDRGF
jgi:hypothetical protein